MQPRLAGGADRGPRPGTHAAVAMRRFMAHTLDARLDDLGADATPAELALLVPAVRVLEDLDLQARYLPRRPSLLPKLMSAINGDTSMRDMAKIIGEDAALLGGLLRLANSSYYRMSGGRPIDSLEMAVSRVGTDGLRSLVATAVLHPVMTGTGGPYSSFAEAIWAHGECAAACAELHAARIERVDAFNARLAVLVLALASNAVFRIARGHGLPDAGVSPAALAKLLEQWAPTMAARIAENWQLPTELRGALAIPRGPGLARSVHFGRLAGALLVMVNHGHLRELSARAIVLADDPHPDIDRLWSRVAIAHLAISRPSGTHRDERRGQADL